MPRELETPRDVDEIYLARGREVQPYRPMMTGDVFAGVTIPGVDDEGEGLAIITTHPCSMRREQGRLQEKLTMAKVSAAEEFPLRAWPKMYPKRMPLPELKGEGDSHFYLADLEEAGRVRAADLAYERRIACLSDFGVVLMLQRLVFAFTREIVDSKTLMKIAEHVLEEARLLEEWNEDVIPNTGGPENLMERLRIEGATFDSLLSSRRADEAGNSYTLREDLQRPARRAAVRRAVREASRERVQMLQLEAIEEDSQTSQVAGSD